MVWFIIGVLSFLVTGILFFQFHAPDLMFVLLGVAAVAYFLTRGEAGERSRTEIKMNKKSRKRHLVWGIPCGLFVVVFIINEYIRPLFS